MAASKSLVEIRAGAGAAAAALPAAPAPADGFGDGEAAGVGTFGMGFVGVDMMGRLFPLSLVVPAVVPAICVSDIGVSGIGVSTTLGFSLFLIR
jgi:hypothetical protein